MSVSRSQSIAIGKELDAAVAEVLARHGLVQEGVARVGYGSGFSYKVEARAEGAPSTFALYASLFGLDPALEGKVIFQQGLSYVIEGLATKSRRYPVLARRNMDGKVYKFTAEAAKRAV